PLPCGFRPGLGAIRFRLDLLCPHHAWRVVVSARPFACLARRQAGRLAHGHLFHRCRGDLRRAADAVRVHGAAYVLPEPHPALGYAPSWAVPDRALLARYHAGTWHAGPAEAARDDAAGACCARYCPAALHCGRPLRRADRTVADAVGALRGDDRPRPLPGDELDDGGRRHSLLVPDPRSAGLTAGPRLARRAHFHLRAGHVPADRYRRDDRLRPSRPLRLLRLVRAS